MGGKRARTLDGFSSFFAWLPPGGVVHVHSRQAGAHVAQAVEHFLGKEVVTGSIPVVGLKKAIKSGFLKTTKIE